MPSKPLSSIVMSLPFKIRMASIPAWVVAKRNPRIASQLASLISRTFSLEPPYWNVARLPLAPSADRMTIGDDDVPLAVIPHVVVYVPGAKTNSSPALAEFTMLHQLSLGVTFRAVSGRLTTLLKVARHILSASAVTTPSAQSA